MCDFTLPFTVSPENLVQKVDKAISGIGGTFSGDTSAGEFALSTPIGKITGSYRTQGQTLQVHIAEKPFFVSCAQIEAQLKKALEGA